jgi:aspartyl-tRNA(Asn)/glutamyl-tRNA(Gln) amidotransferase subunit C
MAKISKELVRMISTLAKMKLSDAQIEKYANDLSSVVGYMEEIKNVDVSHMPETARVSDDDNIFREDEVKPSLPQEQVLKNTKSKHNGYFVVDQILADD